MEDSSVTEYDLDFYRNAGIYLLLLLLLWSITVFFTCCKSAWHSLAQSSVVVAIGDHKSVVHNERLVVNGIGTYFIV